VDCHIAEANGLFHAVCQLSHHRVGLLQPYDKDSPMVLGGGWFEILNQVRPKINA